MRPEGRSEAGEVGGPKRRWKPATLAAKMQGFFLGVGAVLSSGEGKLRSGSSNE